MEIKHYPRSSYAAVSLLLPYNRASATFENFENFENIFCQQVSNGFMLFHYSPTGVSNGFMLFHYSPTGVSNGFMLFHYYPGRGSFWLSCTHNVVLFSLRSRFLHQSKNNKTILKIMKKGRKLLQLEQENNRATAARLGGRGGLKN
jgi:hypothetical protein